MRRIYESNALRCDDDEPGVPNEGGRDDKPRAFRSLPTTFLSRLFVPQALIHRAVSVSVSTPAESYPGGATVPIRVELRNPLPVPVSMATRSPVLWAWEVDGVTEASHVPQYDAPDEAGELSFDRGERKRFTRRWSGSFRVSESEWKPAGPGEYTLGARINVDDAAIKGLADETTVRIE